MTQTEWWQAVVTGGAIPVAVFYATHAVRSWVEARRARRVAVEEDEREATIQLAADWHQRMQWARDRAVTAEAALDVERRTAVRERWEARTMADYAYRLRQQIANLGGTPEPWPENRPPSDVD